VCGLRLDDEAVRVAVRLDIDLGTAHICRCGTNVDPSGIHSLVCRQVPGRATRHLAPNYNDCIFRVLGQQEFQPASSHPVWSALQWWQAAKLLYVHLMHGTVARPSHTILRQS